MTIYAAPGAAGAKIAYKAQYGVEPATENALLDSAATSPGNLKKKPKYVTVTNGTMAAIGTLPSGCTLS